MPSELALIPPLVGGFWFVFRCQILYLISLQLGRGIALLLSALFGFVFASVARLIVFALHGFRWGRILESINATAWPFDFSGTAMVSFVLAVAAAEISARQLPMRAVTAWFLRSFPTHDMIDFLYAAMMRIRPVCLTLKSGKVYVGVVQGIPNLDPAGCCIGLLPVLSGYRGRDQQVHFTTDYVEALEALPDADFVKIIPLGNIETAGLFHPAIYSRFFAAHGFEPETPAGTRLKALSAAGPE